MKTDEPSPGTAWSPFRHTTFAVLWIATVVSNIGSWMQSAAAGWLMTTLRPEPFVVARRSPSGLLRHTRSGTAGTLAA